VGERGINRWRSDSGAQEKSTRESAAHGLLCYRHDHMMLNIRPVSLAKA
jgi:hypothetical protein